MLPQRPQKQGLGQGYTSGHKGFKLPHYLWASLEAMVLGNSLHGGPQPSARVKGIPVVQLYKRKGTPILSQVTLHWDCDLRLVLGGDILQNLSVIPDGVVTLSQPPMKSRDSVNRTCRKMSFHQMVILLSTLLLRLLISKKCVHTYARETCF